MIDQIIANGFILGAQIALMAIGMTLIFGILRIVNFAHGEFYMLGAMIAFYSIVQIGISYIWASLIAIAAIGLLGWIAERLVFRRFHGDLIGGCIAAIALSIGFQAVSWVIFGPKPGRISSVVTGSVEIFGAIVTTERLLIAGVSLTVLLGMAWLISYTKLGKSMRAVQQDSEAALTLGISVKFVCGLTFGIATTLAALAGILVAPLYTITPGIGIMPLIFAFIVIIIGGMGSIMGAFVAAFIIGFQQSFTSSFWGPQFSLAVSFGLAIIVLIFRPRVLMGHA